MEALGGAGKPFPLGPLCEYNGTHECSGGVLLGQYQKKQKSRHYLGHGSRLDFSDANFMSPRYHLNKTAFFSFNQVEL